VAAKNFIGFVIDIRQIDIRQLTPREIHCNAVIASFIVDRIFFE
jgi:hypothetical protein